MTTVWPSSVTAVAEEAEQLGARPRVEGTGGLVGEDDLRARGQRPGRGDALLLATGELRGPVAERDR